jgi:hypothetical protein
LDERKKKGKGWKMRKWTFLICLSLLLSIILFCLYPTLEDSWNRLAGKITDETKKCCKQCRPWWLPLVVCVFLFIFSFVITYFLHWVVSEEFSSRYKFRRDKTKKNGDNGGGKNDKSDKGKPDKSKKLK